MLGQEMYNAKKQRRPNFLQALNTGLHPPRAAVSLPVPLKISGAASEGFTESEYKDSKQRRVPNRWAQCPQSSHLK